MSWYPNNNRCHACEGDWDPCDNCLAKDKADYEAAHYYCEQSKEVGNKKPASECKLKTIHAKLDACTLCGYQFNYP